MICPRWTRSSLFFLWAFASLNILSAEEVQKITPDAQLQLNEGRSISLMGLVIMPETVPLIAALVSHKQMEVEFEPSETVKAYIYLNTDEINLPFDPIQKPKSNRIMLNEILLSTGSARVDDGQEFSKKSQFKALEEEAKQKGYGLWSYEPFKVKKVSVIPESVSLEP